MFESYVPDVYVKSIYYIDYNKLWRLGIRCLIFKLENTICPYGINEPTKRQKKLFDELKNTGFKVVIVSNKSRKKLGIFKNNLYVDACFLGVKIKKEKYNKILETYKLKSNEVASIGDKLVSDIYMANSMDMTSILVNSLTDKDITLNIIAKIKENIIRRNLSNNDLLKVGKYYE